MIFEFINIIFNLDDVLCFIPYFNYLVIFNFYFMDVSYFSDILYSNLYFKVSVREK